MKFTLVMVSFVMLSAMAYAQIQSPSNLHATQKWNNGQQYIDITFSKPTLLGYDSTLVSYDVIRWNGAPPDTMYRSVVDRVEGGGGSIGECYDYDIRFSTNPNNDSGTSNAYTYSVVTVVNTNGDSSNTGSTLYSALATPVSVELDTVQMMFTSSADYYNFLKNGDTLKIHFQAVSSPGATITYTLLNGNDSLSQSAGINSTTGAFWATRLTYGLSLYNVVATDNIGRSASVGFQLITAVPRDTLAVTLEDPKTGPLGHGILTYWALIGNSSRTDTTYPNSPSGVVTDSGGLHYVICDSGLYTLRVSAEGYEAAWVNDVHGLATIGTSGETKVMLKPAVQYTFSGTVTNEKNLPIVNTPVAVTRRYGSLYYKQGQDIAWTQTDAKGDYSFTIPAGDSILGTDEIYIRASASGYDDSPQDYSASGNPNAPMPILVAQNLSNLDFQFMHLSSEMGGVSVGVIFPNASKNTYNMAQITAYQLTANGATVVFTDSLYAQERPLWLRLPVGTYFLYADPMATYQPDSNGTYLAGYYSRKGYAATWQEADTVVIYPNSAPDTLYITLKADSSAMPPGGGSQIAGYVRDTANNPLPGAHLLLYKHSSSPAGTTAVTKLVKTVSTDNIGNYTFAHVAHGTYSITVDYLGGPLRGFNNIVVDSNGTPVQEIISYNTSDITEHTPAQPGAPMLAQNYPNPFSTATSVAFTITAPHASVDLGVFDMAGRRVATMVNEQMEQGSYLVEFNQPLLPGVYSCVLRNGSTVERRMMTVVR